MSFTSSARIGALRAKFGERGESSTDVMLALGLSATELVLTSGGSRSDSEWLPIHVQTANKTDGGLVIAGVGRRDHFVLFQRAAGKRQCNRPTSANHSTRPAIGWSPLLPKPQNTKPTNNCLHTFFLVSIKSLPPKFHLQLSNSQISSKIKSPHRFLSPNEESQTSRTLPWGFR
jgi:hypothetical protein